MSVKIYLRRYNWAQKFYNYEGKNRGGVKLEFVRNWFDLVQKFAIRLIPKDKNIRKI